MIRTRQSYVRLHFALPQMSPNKLDSFHVKKWFFEVASPLKPRKQCCSLKVFDIIRLLEAHKKRNSTFDLLTNSSYHHKLVVSSAFVSSYPIHPS